jgi:hypothetical protein
MSAGESGMGPVGYSSWRPPAYSCEEEDDDDDDDDGGEGLLLWDCGGAAGKNLANSFSRERVLAWKRGPDCVYPARHDSLVSTSQRRQTLQQERAALP